MQATLLVIYSSATSIILSAIDIRIILSVYTISSILLLPPVYGFAMSLAVR